MLKKSLLIIHVVSICIIALHLLCRYFFNIGFAQQVLFYIKLITVISGFLIAVFYLKSLYNKRYYFGIYPLGVLVYLFGYFFRGFLGGLLVSVTMYPIVPDTLAFQQQETTIYTKYLGFFSLCCTYSVYENVYGIFEKHYGDFEVEGSDLVIKNVQNTTKTLEITHEKYIYNEVKKDMVLEDVTIIYKK